MRKFTNAVARGEAVEGIAPGIRRQSPVLAAATRHLARLRADRRGNVAVIAGLLMVPMVGTLGLGFEVSNWYLTKHAMQNAADAAAIAASTNGGSNYDVEAKAVTASYGFVDGLNNVTVTASNAAACPAGGNSCYSVTISGLVPLYLSQVVGYKGDTILNGITLKAVTSTAVATQANTNVKLCLLALATSGAPQGIRSNGAPKANMTGCDVMSNTNATCNGGNLLATVGIAAKTDNGCGLKQVSNAKKVADPYSTQVTNGLADINSKGANGGCKSYPQEPSKKKDPPLPVSNQLSGSYSWSGNQIFCGDVQLTADVTISASDNAVLVIENGQLDTNGFKLSTSAGSGLTLVFSGDNGSYTHAPTGGGTLDFAAPTTGLWKGIALAQDAGLTSGVDISAAGNQPTWDITGLVYLPNSSVTFSGAVNKSSFGASCFVMIVDNVLINGTAMILETGGCGAAGLAMPVATIPAKGQLVL
jgi:Flp pilus assembly protein TadG